MSIFGRILAAIDDSSTSEAPLREAIKLAKDLHSVLRIALVVDVVTLDGESPYQLVEYEDSIRMTGDRLLAQSAAVAREAGIEAETVRLEIHSLRDCIAEELVGNAKAWRADLIVIGTHGRRGLSRLFVGSVAESVARIATVPVLVVRDRPERK